MRLSLVVFCAALAVLVNPAAAQWAAWDYDFDEEKKTWKEIEAKIPPYPQTRNLLHLASGASANRFYIDAESVLLGEDGVVRYTAVMRTAGGATNVSFEGIRCETREHKLYALGRSDGSWVRARDTKWKYIELREIAPYHHMLWREYFCVSPRQPATARQAIEALKRGGVRDVSSEGRERP